MAQEGLKKKDIQRAVQKVHIGSAVTSSELNADVTSDRVELGFPAEKVTLVCTGTLAASVQPLAGAANANTAINATTTPSTTTTSHMFSSVRITRTSGTGRVIVLAK